ncbi:MAG: helix-turn-helix domain-containing protein [Lachnospiraceae bacterium]|nr:helix-turn-helix domain-containing protein [Lachnospiraceae bacterium]MBR2401997.1 helix-turn-helix domain-containing protein [Lachnospiraceae bacterium]
MNQIQSREQKLRNLILDNYVSLRQFAIAADIPYSSLTTGLSRGIAGMQFDTVIKICKALNIEPLDL